VTVATGLPQPTADNKQRNTNVLRMGKSLEKP
jgi:hypothetical protein